MRTFTRISLAMLVAAAPASAERISIPVTGAALAEGASGKVQVVLTPAEPSLPANVSIGDARLVLPAETVSDRDLRIHVRALSADWTGGDVETHEGLVGRTSVAGSAAASSLDLSNLVRGVLSGSELHGLLVTSPGGEGFDEDDGAALRSVFGRAVLEVTFRRVPPAPRSQRG